MWPNQKTLKCSLSPVVSRFNKEFNYMYEESSDDGGKISAMRHPNLMAMRGRIVKRPGYVEEKTCWRSCTRNPVCSALCSREFWLTFFASCLVAFIVYLFTTTAPYCGEDKEEPGCVYNKLFVPWDCRPCPRNALCDGTNMVSLLKF
jgi:hypothetical protein